MIFSTSMCVGWDSCLSCGLCWITLRYHFKETILLKCLLGFFFTPYFKTCKKRKILPGWTILSTKLRKYSTVWFLSLWEELYLYVLLMCNLYVQCTQMIFWTKHTSRTFKIKVFKITYLSINNITYALLLWVILVKYIDGFPNNSVCLRINYEHK